MDLNGLSSLFAQIAQLDKTYPIVSVIIFFALVGLVFLAVGVIQAVIHADEVTTFLSPQKRKHKAQAAAHRAMVEATRALELPQTVDELSTSLPLLSGTERSEVDELIERATLLAQQASTTYAHASQLYNPDWDKNPIEEFQAMEATFREINGKIEEVEQIVAKLTVKKQQALRSIPPSLKRAQPTED